MGTEADLRSIVGHMAFREGFALVPVTTCSLQPVCFQILFRWLNSSVTHSSFGWC